jgi:hypothetical protein
MPGEGRALFAGGRRNNFALPEFPMKRILDQRGRRFILLASSSLFVFSAFSYWSANTRRRAGEYSPDDS